MVPVAKSVSRADRLRTGGSGARPLRPHSRAGARRAILLVVLALLVGLIGACVVDGPPSLIGWRCPGDRDCGPGLVCSADRLCERPDVSCSGRADCMEEELCLDGRCRPAVLAGDGPKADGGG